MSRWPFAGPSEYWLPASIPASKVKTAIHTQYNKYSYPHTSNQSMPLHPTFWRSILILSFYLPRLNVSTTWMKSTCCISICRSSTTQPQWGDNIFGQAVARPMVRPTGVQSLASAISTSDPLQLVLWGFVRDDVYVSPILVGPNILKDRRRRTTSENENLSAICAAQSRIWSDMCRETNGTRTELA